MRELYDVRKIFANNSQESWIDITSLFSHVSRIMQKFERHYVLDSFIMQLRKIELKDTRHLSITTLFISIPLPHSSKKHPTGQSIMNSFSQVKSICAMFPPQIQNGLSKQLPTSSKLLTRIFSQRPKKQKNQNLSLLNLVIQKPGVSPKEEETAEMNIKKAISEYSIKICLELFTYLIKSYLFVQWIIYPFNFAEYILNVQFYSFIHILI